MRDLALLLLLKCKVYVKAFGRESNLERIRGKAERRSPQTLNPKP